MQLKVVTWTLNAQKHQDEILKSGVRSPLDSLDGENMVLQDNRYDYKTSLTSLYSHHRGIQKSTENR